MDKKITKYFGGKFLLLGVLGSLFIGCATNVETPAPKQNHEKIILKEKAVVNNVKCLDKKCFKKELTLYLVEERIKVKVDVKNNKKYNIGDIILLKIK